jgi:lysophospholipase L1-like esterase
VHFNAKGYKLIGNLMFDAIKRSYEYNSSLTKKGK